MLPYKWDANASEETRKFLLSVVKICMDFVDKSNSREEKVIDFHQPQEMIKMFDFSILDQPVELERLLEDCKQALHYQVKIGKFVLRVNRESNRLSQAEVEMR